MDRDDQPSTSKKYISQLRTDIPHANPTYPVTIEQFQNYTNVEEYLINDMKRAGPNIYRINYKIRHKFIPIVYKKFYSDEATRKQLLKNGLEIKPAPKFLKDKIMMLPTGKVESFVDVKTSNRKNGRLTLSERIELLNSKKRSPKRIEKENCPTIQQKETSSKKTTPKPDRLKNKPLNDEIRKITSFFTALKAPQSKILELDGRKRKAGLMSTNTEPRVKRLKNARPKSEAISRNIQKSSEGKRKPQKKITETQLDEIQSDQISDDASPNIQVMVKIGEPINTELSSANKGSKLPVTNEPISKVESTKNHKTARTTYRKNKRKGIESRPRNRSVNTVYSSDDSDIKSVNSQVNDTPKSPNSDIVEVCEEVHLISEKSPLPRRNRMENFKDHSLSPPKKILPNDEDAAMSLFNVSERSSPIFNRSSVGATIHGLEGVAAFEDGGFANNIEFIQEEFISMDRLEAIRRYPEKVRSYIKHLLRLEIRKTSGKAQSSSRSKVVSAFLQMSFEEYKNLINANSSLPDSVIVSLREQYEAIVNKTKPWPKGVHIKLPTLITFLQSKGILQPIQLQHIPPRILSFMDVLANTNLQEYISLSRKKPPDSYNSLLHLCKKEYRRCCEDGIWNEQIQFKNAASEEVINPESVGQLNVESSDLRSEVNEGQSAVKPQESLQPEQVANASAPQTVEDKSEQPDTSKAGTRQKKKKKQIISSFQIDEIMEDYLDAMFRDSDSETSQCAAVVDHDYHAIKATDIDKPRDSSIDRNTNAPVERISTDDLLASLQTSVGLKEPQEVNIPTSSETSLAPKESEQAIEKVNVPVEMADPELLPAPPEESMAKTINDTPDSAGELLSDTIHPQPTENTIEVLIPPSPNLFQSSGESQSNCTQSQHINAQPPESVYVPCNHNMSMTLNTEPNNLTICIDPTSDSEDPFVETVNNQEDNMVTPLPSLDPGLVVKQELLSQHDASNKCCDYSQNDSVQIIEVHSPEPIVIADSQEMAQQLLDILTNPTTKPEGTKSSKAVNHSNLNNNHNEPLIAQVVTAHSGTSHNEESKQVAEVSGSELPETKVFIPLTQIVEVPSQHIVPEEGASDISDSVEIIEVPSPEPIIVDEEETTPELLDMLLSRPTKTPNPDRRQVNLNPNDPSFSCLDNFPQAQRFPSHFSFTQSQSIVHECPNMPSSPQREEAENVDQNKRSPQVDLSVVPTKETNTSKIVTEEILPGGSSESVSYASIAPQTIPSDIDFIKSGSNDPLKRAYDHGVSKTPNQISSEECDDESKVYIYVTLGIDVNAETSMRDQRNVTSALKTLCSEAEIPLKAGSQRDVPEDRTTHVDSSKNTKEAVGSIQPQNLNLSTPSNCDISKALELPAYGEEDMSSAPVKGIELQEPNIDTAQVGVSNSVKDDGANETNKGDLNEVDENQNHSKQASSGNQLLEKPQQSCVSADQPKVGSEASNRQVSGNCHNQYRNVESSEIIQQSHISLDATTVLLTSADNSKIVDPAITSSKANDKAPAKDKQNQLMDVELPRDVDHCEKSAPSLIKDDNASTKYLPEANRSQDQQPKDKMKKVELPKVATNAFIEKEAVSSSNIEQNHLLDTVPVEMSKVTSPRIAVFENQFQNVRISRGTHRRNVSKNDAPKPKDGTSGVSGANKQKAIPSEHNQETEKSQQTHIFADKSTISKGESRDRSHSQEVMLEKSGDAGSFRDKSTNLVLSTATEDSLPTEMLTFGSEQIERMETNDKDVVPRNTIYAIESCCESGQSHVSSSDLTTSLDNTDLCNALEQFSECNSKYSGVGPENTDSSTTQKHTETALLPTGAHILQELGEKDPDLDSLNVENGIPCNMQAVFSIDCHEVTVETISNQHVSQATSRQNSGSNLESATTVMDQSCSTEALQDLCHDVATPAAMEQSSQIPVSSAKSISNMMSPSSSHRTAKLQSTAIKEGKPGVVTPNTVQQTEPPIMPQAIDAANTNQVTDMTTSTTLKTYTFPALLPIGAGSIDRPDEIIEGEIVIDTDEQDVVVPLLIKGRYLRSLPFKILSQKQVQLHWERSQILGMEVKFEIGLNENTMTFVESVEEEAITQKSEVTAVPADTITENLNITNMKTLATPDTKASQVYGISASEPVQSLHKPDKSPTTIVPEATVSSSTREIVGVDSRQISVQPKFTQSPFKRKPAPKTLNKKTTKISLKKPDPEFVPQKTHEFRSLPMGAIKKPLSSETPTTHVPPSAPLTTVEEIDFLIEDASQVIPTSSTASQILGTDCTYFESSQLLNNIEEHCAQQATTSKQAEQQQCHSRTKPKVNTLNAPTILSDGITARKVWKVHLQWTTQKKMTIETRFITDRRWLSSYDESAKLMFHFSPTTWSNILRVLQEIDHYEYRRMAAKERKHCPVVTPLHRVLRYLFDTAPQIVNVRLINDIHSPFTMCETSTPLYRKPFQCLTNGIPTNILNRMKALKRDLLTANADDKRPVPGHVP